MWAAGFMLIYTASAEQNGHYSMHKNYLARLKQAYNWRSSFEPTPQTLRIAARMMYIYTFVFCFIALSSPSLGELSWSGWVFVEHTVALYLTLLLTAVVVSYWIRHRPKGQTVPQACFDRFSRI